MKVTIYSPRYLKSTFGGVDIALVIRKVEAGDWTDADPAKGESDNAAGKGAGVETELVEIRDQVEQARCILADAIAKLDDSFASLERDTAEQRSAMQALLGRMNGADDKGEKDDKVSIRRFARETTGVLGQFTELLASVSAQSMRTVDRIDDMAAELDETFKLVSSVNDIADDTYLLAVNASIEAAHAGNAGRSFAVIAANVRELSKKWDPLESTCRHASLSIL